jgi:hypothetical protein
MSRQQVRVEQKRRARQRTGQLWENLRQVLEVLRAQGGGGEEDVRIRDRHVRVPEPPRVHRGLMVAAVRRNAPRESSKPVISTKSSSQTS